MPDFGSLLRGVSLAMLLVGLALSELGLPIPETALVIAIGIVSEQTGMPLLVPTLMSCLAVLAGDLALYGLSRRIGHAALTRRPLRWIFPERVRPRIDRLFERHGAMAIFVARFISGVRLAAFAMAGMRRMPVLRFALWDSLAILVTVPVFAVLGYLFARSTEALKSHVAHANLVVLSILVLVVVAYVVVVRYGSMRRAPPDSNP